MLENVGNAVFETDTANDLAPAANATSIAAGVVLTLGNSTLSNAAGSTTSASITRNFDLADPLTVSLGNTDTADVACRAR